MSVENESPSNERNSVSTWQIGFLFTGLAIFAPAYAIIYWSLGHTIFVHIYGMLWWFWCDISSGEWWLVSGPFAFGQTMLFTLLRPLFAVQMVRYYRGSSSKRLTFLVGLITELQPIVVNFQTMLWFTDSNLILRLPIPILLFIGIIVMKFVPPPQKQPELWLEEEEKGHSKGNDDRNIQSSKLDIIYKILQTVLASEIILFILGGVFVTNMHPFPLQFLYWVLIPWVTLITGVLFLIVRYIKRRRALWALYGLD